MHPNAELLRKAYDAFGRGDFDTVRNECFAPDIVFYIPGNNQISGEYNGVDAVFAMLMKVGQLSAGTFRLDIHDVTASDDHAVGITYGTGERDGSPFRYRNLHVADISSGRITAFFEFPDMPDYDQVWS